MNSLVGDGYAIAGPGNLAGPGDFPIAGPRGFPIAGPRGFPIAGPRGFAIAGLGGFAIAGFGNLTIAGPGGFVIARFGSFAIAGLDGCCAIVRPGRCVATGGPGDFRGVRLGSRGASAAGDFTRARLARCRAIGGPGGCALTGPAGSAATVFGPGAGLGGRHTIVRSGDSTIVGTSGGSGLRAVPLAGHYCPAPGAG